MMALRARWRFNWNIKPALDDCPKGGFVACNIWNGKTACYLLENCGARRAPLRPYFFLSLHPRVAGEEAGLQRGASASSY